MMLNQNCLDVKETRGAIVYDLSALFKAFSSDARHHINIVYCIYLLTFVDKQVLLILGRRTI